MNSMRQGPNNRRPRSRHPGGGQGGHTGGGHSGGGSPGNSSVPSGGRDNRPRSASSLRHQTFDSNCIDLRVRGNAWQVQEKYQALARDAQSAGDRVAAENYLQHAEHYYRIIEAINEATAEEQRQRGGPPPVSQQPQSIAPYGSQQPEMPANYYGAPGQPSQPSTPGNPDAAGNANSGSAPAQPADAPSQAEVSQRNPPPNNFFATDDTDDQIGNQQVVAGRR